MTERDPSDELLARYREASAADSRVPAERVRAAVRAHAQMVVEAEQQAGPALLPYGDQPPPAANESRWKMSALASVAVLGLAGLLVLQFEHGSPEQKEVALGVPAPSQVQKAEAEQQPAPAPAAVARREDTAAPRQEPPPPAAQKQTRVAAANPAAGRAEPPVAAAPAIPEPSRSTKAAAPAADADLARAPRAFPGSSSIEQSAVAAPPIVADANSAAAPVEARAPAAAGAASNRPPRTAALAGAQEKGDNQSPALLRSLRERAPAAAASPSPSAGLHAAARNGDLAQVDRLLAQGASLNAPDDAGRTPLIIAVMQGHVEVVRRLLTAGANASLLDREGLDALQHARNQGLNQIVQLLEARR